MSAKTIVNQTKGNEGKQFLTGSVTDERTVKSSLKFLGILFLVFVIGFIVCATATFDIFILRLAMNSAVFILTMFIVYNNGSKRGAEDVAKGEILWQKKEKGQHFSDSERKMCFHPMKGYVIGLIGSILFMIPAFILAATASVQTTDSGTLPSWMQAYISRSDIGNALINYTQPSGMQFIDYLRAIVRVCILPFVNIVGSADKNGMLILERLSPIILLLPAAAYGSGYVSGKNIRKQIHTAISENNRKRLRKEQKRKNEIKRQTARREPEKLN